MALVRLGKNLTFAYWDIRCIYRHLSKQYFKHMMVHEVRWIEYHYLKLPPAASEADKLCLFSASCLPVMQEIIRHRGVSQL